MYICNITGNSFELDDEDKGREKGNKFNYISRYRAICYILTKELYGDVKIIKELECNKDISGIGITESEWSKILENAFNYTNTYVCKDPYFNIYDNNNIDKFNNLDFIVISDTFKHISPYPGILDAFKNLYKMLKPGGVVIFSEPYSLSAHKEHYPTLYDYEFVNIDNKYTIHNNTIYGDIETFDNLKFHGKPPHTIEMRVFSKNSIKYFFEQSGFIDITFHKITKDMNKYGIYFSKNNNINWSLIVSARKPN